MSSAREERLSVVSEEEPLMQSTDLDSALEVTLAVGASDDWRKSSACDRLGHALVTGAPVDVEVLGTLSAVRSRARASPQRFSPFFGPGPVIWDESHQQPSGRSGAQVPYKKSAAVLLASQLRN